MGDADRGEVREEGRLGERVEWMKSDKERNGCNC